MKRIVVILTVLLAFSACEKIKVYPDTPYIEYTAFKVDMVPDELEPERTNSQVTIKFRLEDGDGDVGLGQGDTTGIFAPGKEYYFNLFMFLERKIDGEYISDAGKTDWHWRISDQLIRTGQNKTLIADLEKYNTLLTTEYANTDTIRFRFYVVDRMLHHSDTLVSSDIPFRTATDGYLTPDDLTHTNP